VKPSIVVKRCLEELAASFCTRLYGVTSQKTRVILFIAGRTQILQENEASTVIPISISLPLLHV